MSSDVLCTVAQLVWLSKLVVNEIQSVGRLSLSNLAGECIIVLAFKKHGQGVLGGTMI
jgi:hypothetical protein